jgi:DNA gyrase/topoisomerase IV subunit A
MRAKAAIEQAKKGDKQSIVVSEIPYQVNKARLIEKIADLVARRRSKAFRISATSPIAKACASSSS